MTIRKAFLFVSIGIFALLLATVVGTYFFLHSAISNAFKVRAPIDSAPSITQYATQSPPERASFKPLVAKSLDLTKLAQVETDARPWIRWWWPGGDVDPDVACAELEQFRAEGFGGVEIQAFTMGLVRSGATTEQVIRDRIMSFASQDYYETLSKTMACAQGLGLKLYLNHLSGWPAGGPQVRLEDGLKSLTTTSRKVSGGRTIRMDIPRPQPGMNAHLLALAEVFLDLDIADFPAEKAKLLSVVAMRHVKGAHSLNPFDATDTVELNGSAAIVLDDFVSGGKLEWAAPEGDWTIVFSYLLPTGEAPTLGAQEPAGYVINHLQRDAVTGHYNWAFGQHTSLSKYYGKGFTGIFNDSLEFKVDRLSSDDILREFQSRAGYDLRPRLPAVMVDSRDNFFVRDALQVRSVPKFETGEMDQRVRWDYQKTISDLVIERFVETSARWASSHGLYSRGQSYGIDLDIIRGLGANHIPETEQLSAGGSMAFLKMAGSAGALYGRPIVSAEAFVWEDRDYAIAPRQIKAAGDILFAAGVNQIVYHGAAYPAEGPGYDEVFGDLGWFPWSAPGTGLQFSGQYGPGGVVWEAIPELNAYFTRAQKVLQSGRPDYDVLIYYPFLGFPSAFPNTPGLSDKFLFKGYFPDERPPDKKLADKGVSSLPVLNKLIKVPKDNEDPRRVWLGRLAELTDEFDRQGVTWAWTNAHALEGRGVVSNDNRIDVRNILIFETEAIEIETLDAFDQLRAEGAEIHFVGNTPKRQNGLFRAQTRDAIVTKRVEKLLPGQVSGSAAELVERLDSRLRIDGNENVKRVSRHFGDQGAAEFFTNQSLEARIITLQIDGASPARRNEELNRYWFDPMTAVLWQADITDSGIIPLTLGPLESIFLVSTRQTLDPTGPPLSKRVREGRRTRIDLEQWNLEVNGSMHDMERIMIDTRMRLDLQHAVGPFIYSSTFRLGGRVAYDSLVLDLARVEGVARVSVNGKTEKTVSVDPFLVDITDDVRIGENNIVVTVEPPIRNALVGRALAGDPYTSHLQRYKDDLAPSGLIGEPILLALPAREKTD